MIWTIDQALQLCRSIETIIAPIGFHVGLRGSVLLNGGSDNDLDIVIYPHDSTYACFDELRDALREFGMAQTRTIDQSHAWWRAKGSSDCKPIEIWEYDKRTIDILLVGAS